MKNQYLTVILATYNRCNLLTKTLEALWGQECDGFELNIFVCDDGSTDGTVELLQEFEENEKLRFVRKSEGANNGPAATRNAALKCVETEFVLITDDDTIPHPTWASSHLSFLKEHETLAGVGGPIVGVNSSSISRFIDHSDAMKHPVKDDGYAGYLVTANAAFRTEWLRKVKYFDEAISWPGGEDPDLAFRIRELGGMLGVNDDAIVSHHHRDSLEGLSKMFFNHGKGLAAAIHAGSKKRETNTLRVFGSILRDGSSKILFDRLKIADKMLFLSFSFIRAVSFAAGFATFRFSLQKKVN